MKVWLNTSSLRGAGLDGKAKLTGLIIDRREVGSPGEFANMTDEELVEQARRQAQELGFLAPTKPVPTTH
jgi:hypothetical protein